MYFEKEFRLSRRLCCTLVAIVAILLLACGVTLTATDQEQLIEALLHGWQRVGR